MNDFSKESSDYPEIEAQAAEWVLRHDRGLNAAEQEEHVRWLAADSRHRLCFAQQQKLWDQLGAIERLRPARNSRPNRDLLARTGRAPRRLTWIAPAAIAAAAAVAVILWAPRVRPPAVSPFTPFALASGHNVLSDGSVVDLDAAARGEVRFGSVERGIELIQGEARFVVAKNPKWPFVVHAGGVAIRAVGTAFVVRFEPESVEVLVTEGRVQVSPPRTLSSGPPAQTYLVGAGQEKKIDLQVQIARPLLVAPPPIVKDNGALGAPSPVDLTGMSLAEVVRAFNQRNRVQISIADSDLAAMPMGGRVRFDDLDGFVAMLGTFGVEAQSDGKRITLRRKP